MYIYHIFSIFFSHIFCEVHTEVAGKRPDHVVQQEKQEKIEKERKRKKESEKEEKRKEKLAQKNGETLEPLKKQHFLISNGKKTKFSVANCNFC